MTHHYLTFTGDQPRSIGGVGIFSKHLPPLEVTESIANQYDTAEMKALGWVVTRKEEAIASIESIASIASGKRDDATTQQTRKKS